MMVPEKTMVWDHFPLGMLKLSETVFKYNLNIWMLVLQYQLLY